MSTLIILKDALDLSIGREGQQRSSSPARGNRISERHFKPVAKL